MTAPENKIVRRLTTLDLWMGLRQTANSMKLPLPDADMQARRVQGRRRLQANHPLLRPIVGLPHSQIVAGTAYLTFLFIAAKSLARCVR